MIRISKTENVWNRVSVESLPGLFGISHANQNGSASNKMFINIAFLWRFIYGFQSKVYCIVRSYYMVFVFKRTHRPPVNLIWLTSDLCRVVVCSRKLQKSTRPAKLAGKSWSELPSENPSWSAFPLQGCPRVKPQCRQWLWSILYELGPALLCS